MKCVCLLGAISVLHMVVNVLLQLKMSALELLQLIFKEQMLSPNVYRMAFLATSQQSFTL